MEMNQALGQKLEQLAVQATVQAANKDNDLSPAAVGQPVSKADIRQEAAKLIAADPELSHFTSTESPLQSRVFLGFVITTLGGVVVPWLTKFGFDVSSADSTIQLVIDSVQAVSLVCGPLLSLWGRYASKPLFSGWFK